MAYLLQNHYGRRRGRRSRSLRQGRAWGISPCGGRKLQGGHRMYTLPGISPCGGRKRDGYPRYTVLSRASGEGGEAAHAPGRAPARGPGRRPCRNPGPVRRAPLRGAGGIAMPGRRAALPLPVARRTGSLPWTHAGHGGAGGKGLRRLCAGCGRRRLRPAGRRKPPRWRGLRISGRQGVAHGRTTPARGAGVRRSSFPYRRLPSGSADRPWSRP